MSNYVLNRKGSDVIIKKDKHRLRAEISFVMITNIITIEE